MIERLKPKKRPGQNFFAALIFISGIMVFFLLLFVFKGRELSIYFFEQTVLEKALFPAVKMPVKESLTFKRRIREVYKAARLGNVSEELLLEITIAIAESVKDQKLADEEIEQIERILNKYDQEKQERRMSHGNSVL